MKWHDITREELYEKVWEKPASQLKEEFGVSDVAIAKACRKMEIPKPPRGYWARLQNGRKVKKTPLPKLSKALRLKLALESESMRKAEKLERILEDVEPLKRIVLPQNNRKLNPVARELLKELKFLLPDERDHKRVRLRDSKGLPNVTITTSLINDTVHLFHGIITTLESRGIEYRAARRKYDRPAFQVGKDSICFSIEEPIVTVTRQATDLDKRKPSWEWSLRSEQPSGLITFTLGAGDYYDRSSKMIAQKKEQELEVIAADVVEAIWKYFREKRQARIDSEIEHKQWMEERERNREREAIANHEKKLRDISATRERNLVYAAQWWAIRNTTSDFIDSCESKWKSENPALNDEQIEWLEWAKDRINELPASEELYPDPSADGPFDDQSVPRGGPYPPQRLIPRPPSFPHPPQAAESTKHTSHIHSSEKPYPFWLKHQR